ncbi:MAG: T9SS type A sorting domain-containing protein, partial [Flammeovirgaceae bacterium]|nr:T9SS type A sorting domain-containing protein [Flammeovirgaceae bacterium]MDW8288054.1 T9SS type A sorting domain-containing protein [Flammeovirgaceae bacterium]
KSNATTVARVYSFLHENPAFGTNYYRLKQVDTDGSFSYSHVVVATWESFPSEILLYPSPSLDGKVHFKLNTKELPHFQLFNQQGQILENGIVQETLHFSNLSNGVYYFQIQHRDKSTRLKWVLQK